MTSCSDLYQEMHTRSYETLIQTFQYDEQHLHAKSHSFAEDFDSWLDVLKDRPECPILQAAHAEYQFGLLALAQGQYRHAYMSLRFFLEHGLAAVFFSVREMELRLWLKGQEDIVWSKVVDSDSGVFSKKFCDAFFPELADDVKLYEEMARSVYRQCSEFTHGNHNTTDLLKTGILFNRVAFDGWQEKAETVRLIVMYAMSLRYLRRLSREDIIRVELMTMECLSHVAEIRLYFET